MPELKLGILSKSVKTAHACSGKTGTTKVASTVICSPSFRTRTARFLAGRASPFLAELEAGDSTLLVRVSSPARTALPRNRFISTAAQAVSNLFITIHFQLEGLSFIIAQSQVRAKLIGYFSNALLRYSTCGKENKNQ
jgi:hypothetical protein